MTWGGAREGWPIIYELDGDTSPQEGRSTSYSRGRWAISRQCCREMGGGGGHGCLAWGHQSFRVTSFTRATGPTHPNKNTILFLPQRQSTRPAALRRNSECWGTTAISQRLWPQDPFVSLKFGGGVLEAASWDSCILSVFSISSYTVPKHVKIVRTSKVFTQVSSICWLLPY